MNSNKMKKISEEYQISDILRVVYQSAVESLIYTMLETYSDIAFTVSVISQYKFNSIETH